MFELQSSPAQMPCYCPLFPHRHLARWTLTFALLFAVPATWADKIFLKDGKVLSGEITSETDDVVRIAIVTGTIKDTKSINKVSIERIERSTPEDFAYEEAMKVIPTAPGLTTTEYDQLIKRPKAFLEKYSESSRWHEVEKVIEQLKEERKKVDLGFRKFRKEWLSPSQQLSHRVNMDADALLSQMQALVENWERGWQPSALRVFERMEKEDQGTLAYPEAVELAKEVLPKYGGYLQNEIQYARYEVGKRQKALAGMNDYKRKEYQAVLSQEKQRYERQLKAEEERGIFWTTVDLVDESSLKSGIERVRKEMERLAKVELAPIHEQAEMIYEVENLLAEDNVDEAKTKLAEAMKVRGGVKNTRDHALKVLAAIDSKLEQVQEKVDKQKALAEREASEASKIAAAVKEGTGKDMENGEEEKPLTAAQAIAQMQAQRQAAQKKIEEATPQKTESNPNPKPKPSVTASTAAPSSGGGFKFFYLLPVLLIGATAGVYFLDKKKKAEAGGDEE